MVTRAYFILLTVIRLVRAGSAVVEVTVVRGRTCDVISRRDGESGNTEAPKGSDLSRGGGARWMSPLAVPALDVPGGCARWLWLDVPAGKGKANTKESEHETSRDRTFKLKKVAALLQQRENLVVGEIAGSVCIRYSMCGRGPLRGVSSSRCVETGEGAQTQPARVPSQRHRAREVSSLCLTSGYGMCRLSCVCSPCVGGRATIFSPGPKLERADTTTRAARTQKQGTTRVGTQSHTQKSDLEGLGHGRHDLDCRAGERWRGGRDHRRPLVRPRGLGLGLRARA